MKNDPLLDAAINDLKSQWDNIVSYRQEMMRLAQQANNYRDAMTYGRKAQEPATLYEIEIKDRLDRLCREKYEHQKEQPK